MRYYVYIVRAHQYIKVGLSNHVKKRIETLQIGNPFEIDLITEIPCASKYAAHVLESQIHRRLKKKHVRGEWFHASALALLRETEDMEWSEDEFEEMKIAAAARL